MPYQIFKTKVRTHCSKQEKILFLTLWFQAFNTRNSARPSKGELRLSRSTVYWKLSLTWLLKGYDWHEVEANKAQKTKLDVRKSTNTNKNKL